MAGARTGGSTGAWPCTALLLAAVDAGLGALFFGLFDHEAAVLAALGVPDGYRALGAVAWGGRRPTNPGARPGGRARALGDVVHRGRW